MCYVYVCAHVHMCVRHVSAGIWASPSMSGGWATPTASGAWRRVAMPRWRQRMRAVEIRSRQRRSWLAIGRVRRLVAAAAARRWSQQRRQMRRRLGPKPPSGSAASPHPGQNRGQSPPGSDQKQPAGTTHGPGPTQEPVKPQKELQATRTSTLRRPDPAMLEHDATLHTRHGIERLMYRGRYSAETVSRHTAPQPHPRALPKVLAQAAITLAENCV